MTKEEIFKLINNYLGIKEDNFRFSVIPNFSSKKCKEYKFCESGKGISINVINFYLNRLKDASISKKQYCACKKFSGNDREGFENAICYSEKCVPIIEKCIYDLDLLKAVVMGAVSAEKDRKKFNRLEKFDENKILNDKILKKIKARKKMWQEINEGINRLLEDNGKKKGRILDESDLDNQEMSFISENALMFHGHQLREWKKRNIYWTLSKKPQVVFLGHYHLMCPMIRQNTLIIFNGHFLNEYKTILTNYYLTHVGSAMGRFCNKNGELKGLKFIRP
jgi:hypothetical protein